MVCDKKYLLIVFFFSLMSQDCSGFNSLSSSDDIIPYEQIISKMEKYENQNCSSEKERLAIYAMTFLQDGISSGKILKNELDKYTYIFELKIFKDGKVRNVTIQNSDTKGANDKYYIDYLNKLPQCEFWNAYLGNDKDSITTIVIPLRF